MTFPYQTNEVPLRNHLREIVPPRFDDGASRVKCPARRVADG